MNHFSIQNDMKIVEESDTRLYECKGRVVDEATAAAIIHIANFMQREPDPFVEPVTVAYLIDRIQDLEQKITSLEHRYGTTNQ